MSFAGTFARADAAPVGAATVFAGSTVASVEVVAGTFWLSFHFWKLYI